jgi:hypothetical protein
LVLLQGSRCFGSGFGSLRDISGRDCGIPVFTSFRPGLKEKGAARRQSVPRVVKDSKSSFFHPKVVLRPKGFEAEINRLKKRPTLAECLSRAADAELSLVNMARRPI